MQEYMRSGDPSDEGVPIDMSIVAVVRPRRSNHFSEDPGMSTRKIGCVMLAMIYACGGKAAGQPRIPRDETSSGRRGLRRGMDGYAPGRRR